MDPRKCGPYCFPPPTSNLGIPSHEDKKGAGRWVITLAWWTTWISTWRAIEQSFKKENRRICNTLIVFHVDKREPAADRFLLTTRNYGHSFERITSDELLINGKSKTLYIAYGPQWAEAGSSSPSNITKAFTTEGGMKCALIIGRARVANQESINRFTFFYFTGLAHLLFYERAATLILINGMVKDVKPLLGGLSLVPCSDRWKKQVQHGQLMSLDGASAMPCSQGDWKSHQIDRPFALEF